MATEFQFDTAGTGSVGTLIAAALETAGHAMQSEILGYFQAGLASSLGALLLLIAAIGGIGMIAFGGHYKFGLWFIFGPFIYFWLLFPTIPSKGVRWELINDGKENHLLVQSATQGVTPHGWAEGGNKVGEVSWFFAAYTKFTSSFVENIVKLLNLEVKSANLSFINKTQALQNLLDAKIENPKLINFIQFLFHGDCGAYFSLTMAINSPMLRLDSSQEINKLGREERDRRDATITIDRSIIQQLVEDEVLVNKQGNPFGSIENLIIEIAERQGDRGDGTILSCSDAWYLLTNAVRYNAATIYTLVASQNTPLGMTAEEYGLKLAQRVDAQAKLLRRYTSLFTEAQAPDAERQLPAEGLINCDNNVPTVKENGKDIVIADRDFEDENGVFVLECNSPTVRVIALIREMALRMILKEAGNIRPDIIREQNQPQELLDYQRFDSDIHSAADIRETQASWDYLGKGQYFTYLLSLPYMQGLGLYFLAVTYPFFALFVVFPGKHHSFTLWLGLWLWIKSWDIGFAIVMILDELLYNMFPKAPPITEEFMHDPDFAFKALLQTDPTYSIVTYYNILSVLIGAVPVIMGILVKRGGSEAVHALVQGFHKFAGKSGFAFFQAQAAARNQDLAEISYKRNQNVMRAAVRRSMRSENTNAYFLNIVKADAAINYLEKGSAGTEDGLPSYLSGSAKSLLKTNLTAVRDYNRRMLSNQVKRDVAHAMYNSSYNNDSLDLSKRTIINYYSNHDFVLGHPYHSDVTLASEVIDTGKATSDFMHGRWNSAGGIARKRGEQFLTQRRIK